MDCKYLCIIVDPLSHKANTLNRPQHSLLPLLLLSMKHHHRPSQTASTLRRCPVRTWEANCSSGNEIQEGFNSRSFTTSTLLFPNFSNLKYNKHSYTLAIRQKKKLIQRRLILTQFYHSNFNKIILFIRL